MVIIKIIESFLKFLLIPRKKEMMMKRKKEGKETQGVEDYHIQKKILTLNNATIDRGHQESMSVIDHQEIGQRIREIIEETITVTGVTGEMKEIVEIDMKVETKRKIQKQKKSIRKIKKKKHIS